MIRDPSDGTGFDHLKATFAEASRAFPDIMEPYQVMMADAGEDCAAQTEIMREGLRSTFRRRFPSRRAQSETAPRSPTMGEGKMVQSDTERAKMGLRSPEQGEI